MRIFVITFSRIFSLSSSVDDFSKSSSYSFSLTFSTKLSRSFNAVSRSCLIWSTSLSLSNFSLDTLNCSFVRPTKSTTVDSNCKDSLIWIIFGSLGFSFSFFFSASFFFFSSFSFFFLSSFSFFFLSSGSFSLFLGSFSLGSLSPVESLPSSSLSVNSNRVQLLIRLDCELRSFYCYCAINEIHISQNQLHQNVIRTIKNLIQYFAPKWNKNNKYIYNKLYKN